LKLPAKLLLLLFTNQSSGKLIVQESSLPPSAVQQCALMSEYCCRRCWQISYAIV